MCCSGVNAWSRKKTTSNSCSASTMLRNVFSSTSCDRSASAISAPSAPCTGYTDSMTTPDSNAELYASIRLRPARLDHRYPSRDIRLDQLRAVRRRATRRLEAEARQPFLHRCRCERLVNLRVQPRDDFRGCCARHEHEMEARDDE